MKLPSLTIDSRLRFRNLPKRIQAPLMKGNTIDNPAFENAAKYSPWSSTSVPEKIRFYGTDDETGELSLYRGTNRLMLDDADASRLFSMPFEDNRTIAAVEWPACRIQPSPEQAQMLNEFSSVLANNLRPYGNALLTASTAVGKTVLGLMLAQMLGQRTLVLCHTELIIRAWYSDAHMVFGWNKKRIGLLKTTKMQVGKWLTIGSPKTLMNREEHWPEINRHFGCVIIDEAHNLSSPYIFDFVSQSPAKHIIGLTATDTKNGTLIPQVRQILGPSVVSFNAYGHETSNSMPVSRVHLYNTEFRYDGESDSVDWHDLAMQIAADDDRNSLIVNRVKRDWLNGRVILLVTKSLEHVNVLAHLLEEAGVNNVNRLTGETNADRFYTDKLIQAVKKRKVTCVVGTMQAIKEGANIPALDSLHLAMPTASIEGLEQLIGRIRRKADGKHSSELSYYLDIKCPYLLRLYNRVAMAAFQKLKLPGYSGIAQR